MKIIFKILVLVMLVCPLSVSAQGDTRNDIRFWYNVPLDVQDQEYIIDLCMKYNIAPDLVFAMMDVETGGTYIKDVSNNGCVGLLQLNIPVHKERAKQLGIDNLQDWKNNVWVAIDYLAELFEKYEDVGLVLMAYNGGEGYMQNIKDNVDSTSYLDKVFQRQEEFYASK